MFEAIMAVLVPISHLALVAIGATGLWQMFKIRRQVHQEFFSLGTFLQIEREKAAPVGAMA